ncbi:hypothetical protein DXG03_002869 [Asterophora parasitica]|uniref:Uncharacterized protein n=1 Tax=Asterophora parasitica TaxID=117018 RepID=A0A9P7GB28_9AGAR|nr:hypothetical protein DXG03_002869 [Asterophora parasitica]
MSSSFKRVLTDEGHVSEGYTSPPSSDSLQFNPTGRVFFRSASDTLRDVFPRVPNPTPVVSPRKSNKRSLSDGYNSDGGVDEDKGTSDEDAIDIITGPEPRIPNRPVKALRKPRKPMLATRSLPAGEFILGDNKFNNDATMKPVAEEDDWSSGNFTAQGFDDEDQTSFQPMVLS